jgi:hypothetical protein
MGKKIIIPLGLIFSILFGQIESIKVNPDGSIEIIDDSLLPEKYFLSDTSNLKKLNLEVYNIIKPELDKMVSDYRNEMNSNISSVKYTEKVQSGSYFDESGYLTHLLSMNNPTQFEADYLKSMYTTVNYKRVGKEKNKTFEINRSLWSKTVEWKDIIQFLGGYSESRKKGITNDKVSLFDVEAKLVSIELTGQNRCVANIEIIGNKEFGLKYHLIPKSNYVYEGTYIIDKVNNYSDIYNGFNPNIHFSFDEKKYMTEMKFSRKLDDDKYSPSVKSYQNLMKQMIDDFIPYDEYLKMEHIQIIIEQKKKECEELFHSFQEYCIDVNEKSINYLIAVNFKEKKLNKMIKKFKKTNPSKRPILGQIDTHWDEHSKKQIAIMKYSKEFIKYLFSKNKSNRDILSSLQTIDKIKNTTNFIELLFLLSSKGMGEVYESYSYSKYYDSSILGFHSHGPWKIQYLLDTLPDDYKKWYFMEMNSEWLEMDNSTYKKFMSCEKNASSTYLFSKISTKSSGMSFMYFDIE